MNPPMQNGLPPQWTGPPINGVGSSKSSRDSSPMSRLPGPPLSIPPSQLPPAAKGPPVSSVNVTPQSSPRIPPFTSTPNALSDSVVNKNLQQFNQNVHTTPVKAQNIQRPVSTGPSAQNFETLTSHFSQSSSQLQQMTPPHKPFPQQQQPPNLTPPGLVPQNPKQMPIHAQFSAPPVNSQRQAVSQNVPPQNLIPQVSKPMPIHAQQMSIPAFSQLQNSAHPPPINNRGPGPTVPQNFAPQNLVPQVSNPMSIPAQFSNLPNSAPPVNNRGPVPQNLPPPNLVPQQQYPQNSAPPSLIPQNIPPMSRPPLVSNVQNSAPPSLIPQHVPPMSNASPVSNLHAKRYPQPLQSQYTQPLPQANVYQPQSQLQPQLQPQPQFQPQPQLQPQHQPNANIATIPTNYNNQQYPQQQNNAYYQQQQQQQINQQRNYQNLPQQMQNLNVTKSGFNKLWGQENFDLLQCPNVLPEEQVQPPNVNLGQEFLDNANCSPEIFRCTMTKIPETSSLLQKSRLPLGVLIHPFKDLNHLPVISCNTIVRCRACRTYINPFIFFVDTKRWKCNLCYRVNELPEEFQYDPVSKTYGDPSRRPEIKSSTIEYIAPSEYMLRPPQPAVYIFLLDISRLAVESGYLHTICEVLSGQLATLPGDARTQIGFLAYNSTLHFFSLAEGLSQPHEMIVSDIDDIFLPCPDNLLVNLKEHTDLISDLLTQLPTRYQNSFDTGSALGAALQAAFKLMGATGGRVTVFQATLPQLGPGALTVREDPNQRAGKEAPHLNPATDFYKRLALDCSGHQVAVDLFLMNSQYVDVATLSGISRFSGGCMYHFPLYKASKVDQSESLERCFRRYLTRKIGFEAVMRIRCTRGLAIHTFHGNFFVRSTDLLSLPNVNPDAGFGMQVSIEESLSELQSVCFQAALLYTSSKGERRIRVHTLCLPVVASLSDVLNSADQQCIVGLLGKMAVDRSLQSSLSDARDAFINVAIDILSSYKLSLNMGSSNSGLMAPQSFKLLPLYILALLKCTAFRTGQSTRLDDRVFAMCEMKTLPLPQLVQTVYPDLYPIYRLSECPSEVEDDGTVIPRPRRLQLTARNIDSHGAYLLDAGQKMILFVCQNVSQQFLVHSLGVPNFASIPDNCYELQKIENPDNERLHSFISRLNDEKPYPAALQIMRENSPNRNQMLEHLIEDRIEYALSYNEFLQHLKTQVK